MNENFFPSVMTMDLDMFREQVTYLDKKVESFHIDVMDGHFVPNLTLSPWFISEMRKMTSAPMSAQFNGNRSSILSERTH